MKKRRPQIDGVRESRREVRRERSRAERKARLARPAATHATEPFRPPIARASSARVAIALGGGPVGQGPAIIERLGGVDREAAARLVCFWKTGTFSR